eukprot:Plantae.Rhodophyta-Hildenbrandia_rubra.ctg10696.p1 GENE.Plantae.Rhodophyta-Hildenbrandia_rubra.ctg10696~~Plantae.Rhodophyta-Hildenbrandia_rubra.ctg10696.p1  ORF type:complete len:288 (-),score=81.79 Plantae.Rhodophyta-Hildenbrandia_rubra.ctg10696:773-1636(-)
MASDFTIIRLRRRLKEKQQDLAQLQKRIESREETVAASVVQNKNADEKQREEPIESASGVAKRFVSAVAEGKAKKSTGSEAPAVSSGKVSSLLSKWNTGISGVVEKKETAFIRGDVREAQRRFSKKDGRGIVVKKLGGTVESDMLVEDDEDIPSWAKNQTKRVLRKSNPKSTTRGVDVGRLQEEIQDTGVDDYGDGRTEMVPKSNKVSSVLVRWGKAADEEEKAKEEKLSKDMKGLNLGNGKALADGEEGEPTNPKELITFLEGKIQKVEKDIVDAKRKLRGLEQAC